MIQTTIELFSGTKSFSKVADAKGFSTLTIDNDKENDPDIYTDVRRFKSLPKCNILWASPPCTAFSVASIGKHWDKQTGNPKTLTASIGLELLEHTIYLISVSNPQYWYIENPRGMMRKKIDALFKKYNITEYKRETISYCQYELDKPVNERRMKPTDIWTNNFNWKPKPLCKYGDNCHCSAPRGSRTGTQGLKTAKDRGVIPPKLIEEILA